MVKTPRFHCWGCGFNPWSGKFHVPSGAAKKKKPRKTKVSLPSAHCPILSGLWIKCKMSVLPPKAFSRALGWLPLGQGQPLEWLCLLGTRIPRLPW